MGQLHFMRVKIYLLFSLFDFSFAFSFFFFLSFFYRNIDEWTGGIKKLLSSFGLIKNVPIFGLLFKAFASCCSFDVFDDYLIHFLFFLLFVIFPRINHCERRWGKMNEKPFVSNTQHVLMFGKNLSVKNIKNTSFPCFDIVRIVR